MKQPGIMFLIFGFSGSLSTTKTTAASPFIHPSDLYLCCTTITNYCNRCGLVRRCLGKLLVLVRPIRASVRNQYLDQRGDGICF